MVTRAPTLTADELLAMPKDGYRYELVKGELRKMAPAGSEHGMIAVEIATSLNRYVKEHRLGKVFAAETGFKLSEKPDTVRAPDVAFVGRERAEAVGRITGYWPGAPDFVAEVVSPHDSYTEVQEKVAEWLAAGSRLVIVIDAAKRAAIVYRSLADFAILSAGDTLEGGEVVPGWRLPLAELFDDD